MRASSADRREATLGGHPQALERYALAVLSHIGLVAAWYLFVKLGEVPKFVMPSPYDTVHALVVPNYRWPENIAVTAVEIFAGYILAVVFGIGAALPTRGQGYNCALLANAIGGDGHCRT